MAVCIRNSLSGSRRALACAFSAHRSCVEPRITSTALRTTPLRPHLSTTTPPTESHPPSVLSAPEDAGAVATSEASFQFQANIVEEELFRALCEPRPSNPLLVSLLRRLVQHGGAPSLEVVRAIADHFSVTKDAQNSTAVLSLLKQAYPVPVSSEQNSYRISEADDPVGVMYLSVVRAHCRRSDIPRALAALVEMEDTGRQASANVVVSLLEACAVSRPPLPSEADAVWSLIQEREISARDGVQQILFTARMVAEANCAGYAPVDENQGEWNKVVLERVDQAWDDMLTALGESVPAEEGAHVQGKKEVAARSWLARAAALALCARDSGASSGVAISRSQEALHMYLHSGGSVVAGEDIVSLAEIVRGLARCGRHHELGALLASLRQPVSRPEDDTTASILAKARARTSAAQAERVSDALLRALGARGKGLDSTEPEERRAYGLSLLKVIEEVAAEAQVSGKQSQGDVSSRLTATLQAVLAASHFLGRDHAGTINSAARSAMDTAASAIGSRSAEEEELEQEKEGVNQWPGADLAALSLYALLHVSKQPREGIPVAIGVLQQMHDRELCPPSSLAGQLDTLVRRYGTVRQKRRAKFLLARALDGFGFVEEEAAADNAEQNLEAGETSGNTNCDDGVGGSILAMVRSSNTRGKDEWDPDQRVANEEDIDAVGEGAGSLSAQQSYRVLQESMRELPRKFVSAGVRAVERACKDEQADRLPLPDSHEDVLRRVTVLAERGRAHAALSALHTVDGRKRGTRAAVPYRVYGLVFRALSNGYSARGREELELAAAPMESLQWLLRGMARQGYKPNTTLLNFGLEAFAVAASSKVVQEGGEDARARVCTEAMDFMEGLRDGWKGLHPPVRPNVVSFSIVIKIMCRLYMFGQAFEVLDVMDRSGCTPDRVTYSTLIHGLSKAGDNDAAWEVMVAMTNQGITPHSIAIDGIVDGYVRSGEIGQAISFSQHAFNQYGCAPTPAKFCRVVRAATELDDGMNETRRAVVVAEQMWSQEWRGEGTHHPVLGHPHVKALLQECGVLDQGLQL